MFLKRSVSCPPRHLVVQPVATPPTDQKVHRQAHVRREVTPPAQKIQSTKQPELEPQQAARSPNDGAQLRALQSELAQLKEEKGHVERKVAALQQQQQRELKRQQQKQQQQLTQQQLSQPQPQKQQSDRPLLEEEGSARRGSVLVLTILKDQQSFGGARDFPAYLEMLRGLGHPPARTSLGILVSDESAYAAIMQHLRRAASAAAPNRHPLAGYHAIRVFKRDLSAGGGGASSLGRSDAQRHAAHAQRRRRSALARYRNLLLSLALRDEEACLWIDADIERLPPGFLAAALASDKHIVTPQCLRGGRNYDLNAWHGPRVKPSEYERGVIARGGLFVPRPVPGLTRHVDALERALPPAATFAPLTSVGGTVLLVRSWVHRQGAIFPPLYLIGAEWGQQGGYDGIETEGLCYLAASVGARCWAAPRYKAIHHDS